jgi:hypothetical protein
LGQVTEAAQGAVDNVDTNLEVAATEDSLNEVTSSGNTAVENIDTEVDLSANADAITTAGNAAVNKINKNITLKASMSPFKLNVRGSATGTITIAAAARGLKDAPGGPVLVSEEGPELIQTADGAYMTGMNGPEIVNLNRGDTVYTAE